MPHGEKAPGHHRPAAGDVDPLLAGIPHDQRAQRESEGNGESDVAEIKHGRVDDHLRILQQRIQSVAVGGQRALHQRERMRREVQQQKKEDLNRGDDDRGVGEQPRIGLVPQAQDQAVGREQQQPRTAASLPVPTRARRTYKDRAGRGCCGGGCRRWRNRSGRRR